MPNRLDLTKNVQFYKATTLIDASIISEILDVASSNIEIGKSFIIDILRESKSTNLKIDYKVSIKVFPTVKPVYFLDDNTFEDRIHAFIILIEINKFLVVLSKSCSPYTQNLKKSFDLIQVSDLSKLLGDNAEFQKMSLRNMTVSDKAIRNRSYESVNLIGTLSTHAAGRSIPSHLKVKENGIIKSISSTGRLVEASARHSIDDIVNWASSQINIIKTAHQNEFLNLFARKVHLIDVLKVNRPNALLIDTSAISDEILNQNLKLKWIKRKKIKGSKKKIKEITKYLNEETQNRILFNLSKVYEVNTNGKIIGFENSSEIKKNVKSLSISTKLFRGLKVEENNKTESLIGYINRKGLFSITFNDPKYMYFMNECFEDRSGISEIDSILGLLYPQNGIEMVESEKGKFRKNQKKFNNNSMFGFVEKISAQDDYIFCDDLGDEWADHITLNLDDSCISFIHSKHGEISTSASNLHDVVGQGIKNLGNMFFSKDQIKKKVTTSLMKKYKSREGTQTEIERIRKTTSNFDMDIDLLLKDHKLHRKCILSCSFLSKSDLTMEFSKLKSGAKVRGNIVQLLWILSSFSHAAKEANVIPIIYCDI